MKSSGLYFLTRLVAFPLGVTGVVWVAYRVADRLRPLRERLRPYISGRFIPDEPRSYVRLFLLLTIWQVVTSLLDRVGLYYQLIGFAMVLAWMVIVSEVHRFTKRQREIRPLSRS